MRKLCPVAKCELFDPVELASAGQRRSGGRRGREPFVWLAVGTSSLGYAVPQSAGELRQRISKVACVIRSHDDSLADVVRRVARTLQILLVHEPIAARQQVTPLNVSGWA